MTDLDLHIAEEASPARIAPPLLEGAFARDVSSTSDEAYVSIGAYDPRYQYGPCPWPRHGAALPRKGDRCLVAFTEDEEHPWVVGWWTATPGTTAVWRESRNFLVLGTLAVASGSTDYIPPMFISKRPEETQRLVKVRRVLGSGGSAVVSLHRNGAAITGFSSLTATTTAAATSPDPIDLAEDDALALVVNSVTGSPMNLTFEMVIEHTL